jgi:putative endonuclease
MPGYYVYILANGKRMLYVGVTNDLQRRINEHRLKQIPGYTQHYNISRLVYFESTLNVSAAIVREKQIKGWIREKKLALIEASNPKWADLSEGWRQG